LSIQGGSVNPLEAAVKERRNVRVLAYTDFDYVKIAEAIGKPLRSLMM
jgi:hypothetical protein